MKICHCIVAVIFFSILSCENQHQKEERLAKQHCGSCHAFPQPSLLNKNTWDKTVFPEMAFRMGVDLSQLTTINFDDHAATLAALPNEPLVDQKEWELIKQYYLKNAPDSLVIPDRNIVDTLKLFDTTPLSLPISQYASVTLIKSDTAHRKIYIGSRAGDLYKLNPDFKIENSVKVGSGPSQILETETNSPLVLLMGIMDPNEQFKGKIIKLTENAKPSKVIDSLQRPVDFEKADLNNDKADDFVVCAFGHHTGSLQAYESLPGGKFKRHPILNLPGARKTIIKDFDDNGFNDILVLMTQGDERIILFYNQGNFKFRMATLLRFSPVYGSSYFDIADFNNDGKFDILYTNGDNADYSPILKPYHGVRIFLNNGTNEFKESWFYPMHGASQARLADFDQDGDLDIAAISFFPDFKNRPEHSFIYFENTSNGFVPQITSMGSYGRWITMETGDIDEDGDTDILLGSLTFPTLVPQSLSKQWEKERVSMLVLKNKLH